MLGLGTSLTSIGGASIYRELSELANYGELVLHYDFSLLEGAHEARVASASNRGQGGGTWT